MKTTSLIFLTFLLFSKSALAWTGYDYDNKTEVEIGKLGPGNQLREGLVFQFYDAKDDNYRTAKVLFIQSIPGGTEIKIRDLDSELDRLLVMRDKDDD